MHQFKAWHGIWKLVVYGEKLSVDDEATEDFAREFPEFIAKEKLLSAKITQQDCSGISGQKQPWMLQMK